jgi:hypothetical protein
MPDCTMWAVYVTDRIYHTCDTRFECVTRVTYLVEHGTPSTKKWNIFG